MAWFKRLFGKNTSDTPETNYSYNDESMERVEELADDEADDVEELCDDDLEGVIANRNQRGEDIAYAQMRNKDYFL